MSEQDKFLRIGQLAKQTGELVTTIRFWTKEGLLTVKNYLQCGYVLYDPAVIAQAKEIRRLKTRNR